MKTLLVRNVDAAEAALAQTLHGHGHGEFCTLPIPACVAMTSPAECASFRHKQPSRLLVEVATTIVAAIPREALAQYREGEGVVMLNGHTVASRIDVDGLLQTTTFSRSWNIAEHDLTIFAMVHEYLAAEINVAPGLLFCTFVTTWTGEEIADEDLADPAQDRYSRGQVSAKVPMVSIPVGRWRRELETLIQQKGQGEYQDPWLAGVLAPAFRLQDVEDPDARRAIATDIVAQDWRQAIMEAECTS